MILNLIQVDCEEYVQNETVILQKIKQLIKEGSIRCPNCGSKVYVHSVYWRQVIDAEFCIVKIRILKTKCANVSCAKIHAILPDFIVPKKQYSKKIIKQALVDTIDSDCPVENSTIFRWKKWQKCSAFFE